MKRITIALLATAATFAVASARADTRFSIGVNIGVPTYRSAPPTVVYAPPPAGCPNAGWCRAIAGAAPCVTASPATMRTARNASGLRPTIADPPGAVTPTATTAAPTIATVGDADRLLSLLPP
jgi:hypothetical protein